MLLYAVRRLLLAVPLLLAVSLLVFALVSAFPGDPCLIKLGQRATAENIGRCRVELGLDRPWLERYGDFVAGAVRLDFGRDFFTGEDVGTVMAAKFAATIELAFFALLIAWLLGTWLGTRSALKPGGWSDVLGQLFALGGTSIPVFWLGMLLIVLFGVKLAWLPFTGWTAGEIGQGDRLQERLPVPRVARCAASGRPWAGRCTTWCCRRWRSPRSRWPSSRA